MNLEEILILGELERIGYLNQIRKLARIATCHLYWSSGVLQLGSQVISNGTMVFLELENQIIGVTNYHVYQGYLISKSIFNDVECQIGSATIELEKHIISENKYSDLAVFKIPEIIFNQTGSYYHSVPKWPTKTVHSGELIVCGGYPGNRRIEKIGRIETDFVSFICRVTDTSDRHFSIQLELESAYWPQGKALENKPNLGGMSGGPVYRYISQPIERLEIVGFIYEFGCSDIIFATYSNHIRSNGTIKKSRIV